MEGIGVTHQRSSRVKFEVQSGFATITLEQPESVIGKDVLLSLSNAVTECSCRVQDISAVFLWMASPPQLDHAPDASICAADWQEDVDDVCEMVDRLPQLVVGFAAGPVHNVATRLLLACDVIFATSDAKFRVSETGGASATVPPCLMDHFGSTSVEHVLTVGPCMDGETAHKLGLVAEMVQDVAALRTRLADLHKASLFVPPAIGGSVKQLMRSAIRGIKTQERNPAKGIPWNDEPAYIRTTSFAPQCCTLFADNSQPPATGTLLAWEAPPEAELPLPKFGAATRPCHAESRKEAPKLLEPMRVFLDDTLENDSFVGNMLGGAKDAAAREEAKVKKGKSAGPQRPPKRKNFGAMFESYRGPITSIMICNIPCRIAQAELADVVDNFGFKEKYDYLYLPTGGRSSKAGISNLGYGFINFPEARDTEDFYRTFTGYKFDGTPSLKETSLRPAHVQGCHACEKDQKDQSSDKPAVRQAPRRARRSRRAKTKGEVATLDEEQSDQQAPWKESLFLFEECSV